MIIVTGTIKSKPERFEELKAASLAHVARSRTEDGCISHGVAVDCEDELKLVFFERWRDRAALELHFIQPGSHQFIEVVKACAAERTTLDTYIVSEPASPR